MSKEVEQEIMEEIEEGCNWGEKIVVKLFKRLFIITYKTGVKAGFNWNN